MIHSQQPTSLPPSATNQTDQPPPLPPARQSVITSNQPPPLPPPLSQREHIHNHNPFLGQIRQTQQNSSSGSVNSNSQSFNETTYEIMPTSAIINNNNIINHDSKILFSTNDPNCSSPIAIDVVEESVESNNNQSNTKVIVLDVGDTTQQATRIFDSDNGDTNTDLVPKEDVDGDKNDVGDINDSLPVIYGELAILGYNGSLPQGEKGRRKSKYQLARRQLSNGIKKSKHYSVKQPQSSKAIQDKEQHSISYTLSRSQAIIVEYQHDKETDMFQIGRSSESPIDFVVIDTVQQQQPQQYLHNQQNDHPDHPHKPNVTLPSLQPSTISRFACRILVDRKPPHCARIYAAGFDSSKNIFLGEKATKWQTSHGDIDGLTTNGILIMHPEKPFINKMSSNSNDSADDNSVKSKIRSGGIWREVSVCGGIYSVRATRSAWKQGVRIENETNVLQDGTLIDLCGATLIWRSWEGLCRSPTKRHLEEMIDQLNASRPQCPVGLNTLVIPRKSASLGAEDDKQPYVYLKCGHVQGYHDWGQSKHSNSRTCPMCFKSGPVVKLTMGIEPSYCTDSGAPNFCFNPCGHMASESTVKYWHQVLIPHGTNGFHAMCPFCATPLQGYIKLIFQ